MRHSPLLAAAVLSLAALTFVGGSCNNEEDPMTPEPTITAPANLRAFSESATSVRLSWSLSPSESEPTFSGYLLRVKNPSGALISSQTLSKGTPDASVTGLTVGVVYTFVMRSTKTDGGVSSDSSSIQWSPARRLTTDSTSGPPIQVYEFASALGRSGLQFFSASAGAARTQSLSSGNVNRPLTDIFVSTDSSGGVPTTISLRNVAGLYLGAKNTFFSTVIRDAASLDDPQIAPPAVSSYSLTAIAIPTTPNPVGQARVVYARSVTDNRFVRILIQQNIANNNLYFGSFPDRYVRLQLSYQDSVGNFYARPTADWLAKGTRND